MLQIKELVWKQSTEIDKKILFLSDMHINAAMESEKPDVQDYMRNRTIHFEKEGISHPEKYLDEVEEYGKEKGLDLVILGGDIIDCPSPENIEFLRERLSKLEIPLLYVLGNHDWNYSWDYLTSNSRERHVGRIEEAIRQETDGYLSEIFGIQFLVVDSSCNRVGVNALTRIMECDKSRPLCVAMHVPFTTNTLRQLSVQKWGFETTMGGKGLVMDDTTSAFYHQLSQFNEVLLLCGHVHEFADEMLCPQLRQVVAAAGCEGNGVLIHLKGMK